MLYSEFVEGTGCKDNEHNYKVYENLEVMYMNSDMSKAEVYEYGKKLVDNSKSEAELKVEAEVKAEIEYLKDELNRYKAEIEYLKDELNRYKGYVNNDTQLLTYGKKTETKKWQIITELLSVIGRKKSKPLKQESELASGLLHHNRKS